MLTHAQQKALTAIKRRLKLGIKKMFPSLAPLCRIVSVNRGYANMCVICPMYPDRNPGFEKFVVEYKATLTTDIDFEIAFTYPQFWRGHNGQNDSVAIHSCEWLAAAARYFAETVGPLCEFYSQQFLDERRHRWPANAPLPRHYWEQRKYINAQFQLLCRWIELHGADNLPDIDDISPSMVAATETPRQYRQMADVFEPAW